MDRRKALKWNSISALCYQVILVITSLILPRCFLFFYGSEVNGLITSITQFLSFINICDLGISAVVSSAYYKPLAENNISEVSKIFVYTRHFFRVIGLILVVYIAVLLVAFPALSKTSYDFWFTFTLIAAMGISSLGQYLIGISYQLLLNSDQKSYVQLVINGSTLLLNTVVSVVMMMSGASVQMVKLGTSLIYLLRPLAMWRYVKKHYALQYDLPVDKTVVPQKKSGVIQHIAYMVNENTDVMVLTAFSSLKNVSVYAVYTLATNSIRQIINAATTGVQALLGNMIANREYQQLSETYSFYNWTIHTIATVLYTVTGLMIVPFVSLYTADVTDTDYYAPLFAVLITLGYYFNTIRNCNYVLIRAAGHYTQTQRASLLEAALNLTISIVCVFRFGLIGVAIGTVVAAAFFMLYQSYYFSKNIICYPIKHTLKQMCVDCATAIIVVVLTIRIDIFANTIVSWICQAIIVTVICGAVSFVLQWLFYKENVLLVKTQLRKNLKR